MENLHKKVTCEIDLKLLRIMIKINQELEALNWPPQLPDLSIIENVWSFIKDYLFKINKKKFFNKSDVFHYA